MLTENDASLMTISLISDLDQEFAKASSAVQDRFHTPTNSSVRCARYRDAEHPLIEAYIEAETSPEFTLTLLLDIQFDGNKWTISRSIQRDAATSEQIGRFSDVETGDVEGLREAVLRAAIEGFREFDRTLLNAAAHGSSALI